MVPVLVCDLGMRSSFTSSGRIIAPRSIVRAGDEPAFVRLMEQGQRYLAGREKP